MGTPKSFFFQLLLQYTEHTSMLKILNYNKIFGCFRYLDDIFDYLLV